MIHILFPIRPVARILPVIMHTHFVLGRRTHSSMVMEHFEVFAAPALVLGHQLLVLRHVPQRPQHWLGACSRSSFSNFTWYNGTDILEIY